MYAIVWCRIACRIGRHMRDDRSRARSPGAGSRPRMAGRVREGVVPDRVSSRLCHSDDRTSLRCRRSGEPKARRLPCPGPTWRSSRRRPQRFTNIYSFVWPWRFIVVRSAARLSAIVGPPSPRKAVAERSRTDLHA